MNEINITWFNDLLAEHQPPCVSIYMPVLRNAPPAGENHRLFGDLLARVERSLAERFTDKQVREMMEKVKSVAADGSFWVGDRDAVAIFVSNDFQQVIDLQQRVDAMAEVADSFHIKPLIRVMQTGDRYQLLCLTQRSVELYEGDRYRLERL